MTYFLNRLLDFSNVVGTGDWSADILVRLCVMVNPQAHLRTRMSALRKIKAAHVGKYWVAFPYGLLNSTAMDLLQLTPAQLRQAASLKERITELEGELESILGTSTTATPSRKLHWTQTPAGRARLARSVRKSWRTRRPS